MGTVSFNGIYPSRVYRTDSDGDPTEVYEMYSGDTLVWKKYTDNSHLLLAFYDNSNLTKAYLKHGIITIPNHAWSPRYYHDKIYTDEVSIASAQITAPTNIFLHEGLYNGTIYMTNDALRGILSWGSSSTITDLGNYCNGSSCAFIPPSWDNCINVTSAVSAFYNCMIDYAPNSWQGLNNLVNGNAMFSYGLGAGQYTTTYGLIRLPTTFEGLDSLQTARQMFFYNRFVIINSFAGLSSLLDATSMFQGCLKLTNIPTSWNGLSALTDASAMFKDCKLLTTIPDNWEGFVNLENMTSMFSGCSKLENCGSFYNGLEKVTNVTSLFQNCSLMSGNIYDMYLYLSTKPIPVTSYANCFTGCTGGEGYDMIPSSWGGGKIN